MKDYDANGNVEGVTQTKLTATGVVQETTVRTYDVLDRLEVETRYDTKQTSYEYDAKGNRTKVTDFENVSTAYTFDAQDRLQTAVMAEGATTYGYFPDGLLKTTDFFEGVTHEGRCYDDAGRLTGLVTARASVTDACAPVAGSYVSQHRHTHDGEGNRLTQVEELTGAGGSAPGSAEVTEYGYDEESRLVGVKYPDDTVALYQLDAVGNRVGERKAVGSLVPALTAAAFLAVSPAALTNDVVAVFNRADWLESVTDARAPAKDATFEWDAAGNLRRQLTAGRDRRFTWDVKQTLTKVEDNGVEAGRYDYGADGLRSKRVTALESVEYVLDGMQVLVEAEGSTSSHPAKRRYHYASAALAVTDISGATRTTKALHLDALGSPTTETTQAGAVAAVRQYDAWGLYRNGTAPGSADTKLGYTGHQYDVETGLVYARARYYDPEYGRFLSRDSDEGSLNSAPSLHRFAYAHVNPLRYTDPNGRGALDFLKWLAGKGAPPPVAIDSCTASRGACNEAANVAVEASKTFNSAQATSAFQAPAAAAAPEVGPIIVLGALATGANIEANLKADKTPDPRVVQSYLDGCSAGGSYSCKRLDELGVPRPTVKVATEDSTSLSRLERIVPAVAVEDPSANGAELAGRGKGERGKTSKPDGTDNPFKKYRPDPDDPDRVIYKDPQTGKDKIKPKPPGFDEFWHKKHPPPRPPRVAPDAPTEGPSQPPPKTDVPTTGTQKGHDAPPPPPVKTGGETFEGGGGI